MQTAQTAGIAISYLSGDSLSFRPAVRHNRLCQSIFLPPDFHWCRAAKSAWICALLTPSSVSTRAGEHIARFQKNFRL